MMLYGTESWAVECQQEQKISVTKMRMLCQMSVHTRNELCLNWFDMWEKNQ